MGQPGRRRRDERPDGRKTEFHSGAKPGYDPSGSERLRDILPRSFRSRR
jgi:hypothetical protein